MNKNYYSRVLFLLFLACLLMGSAGTTNADPSTASTEESRIPMTIEEKEWVKANPAVRLGFDPEFMPFEFLSETGELSGIAGEYAALIEERIGIRFVPVSASTWEETLRLFRSGEIDVLPCVGRTVERENYLLFTNPYLTFPRVVVTRLEGEPRTLSELENLRVGVQADSSHHGFIKEASRIDPAVYPTFTGALTALSHGELDAVVGNLAVATHMIGRLALSNLKVANHLQGTHNPLSFGIRKDRPVLHALIDRALSDITVHERTRIQKRWMPVESPTQPRRPGDILTEAERAWVSDHPVIRTGVDPDYAPYSFLGRDGRYRGIALDLIAEVERLTGLTFFPVPDLAWPDILDGARKRSLDLVLTAFKTDEREGFLNFTDIFIPTPLAVMTRKEEKLIHSPKDLTGRRVALVKGYYSTDKVLKDAPRLLPVFVDTPLEGLTAVSANRADAYVGVLGINLHLARESGLTNLKVAAQYQDDDNGQRLASRKDWPELRSILAKALDAMPHGHKTAVFRKWLPIQAEPENFQFEKYLTTEEKEWIKAHPRIRVVSARNWAPVEFMDKTGGYAGIAVEYLQLLEDNLEMDFVFEDVDPWHRGFEMVENGSADMFSTVMETESRREHLLFTKPYLEVPVVVFANADMNYIGGLKELRGRKTCVVAGSAVEEMVRKDFPFLTLVPAPSTEEALGMLERREVAALVESILSGGYYIGKLKNTSLKVTGRTPYTYNLSMAVGKELAPLQGILDKFLDLVPESEKNGVYRKWVSIEYEHGVNYSLLFGSLVPLLLILLIFMYWVRRLKQEISRRRRVEQALTSSRKEAEKANRAKSVFLANMSHEIRTPMNAILGYSQLLNRDRNLTAEQKKSLETINRSGEHLLGLINDILEISRIEAGKYSLEPVVMDLFELLKDLEVMFRIRTDEKGISFRVEHPRNLIRYIRADEGKIRQVLINLIGNAVKFTRKGGILLTVSGKGMDSTGVDSTGVESTGMDSKGTHTKGMEGRGESLDKVFLTFKLEDTGKGIPGEDLARIFESFEQAEGRSEGGTGLGLAISKKYARLMDGDITAESRVDEGSAFTFTCAAEPGDPSDYVAPMDHRRVVGLENREKPVKVLIADDRVTNRRLIRQLLEQVGFFVKEAVNGREAVDIFLAWRPEIVLMDLVMPVMDGFSAIREIRKAPGGDGPAVIAVTASVLASEKDNVLAAGADDFLGKPFREYELFAMLEAHADLRFRYEAAEEEDQGPARPLHKQLDQIPEPIYGNLVSALELGHLDKIHKHIGEIDQHAPDLSRQLKEMADAFDFKTMLELFKA